MDQLDRLHAYIYTSARQRLTPVAAPPFTVFIDATGDAPGASFAMLDDPRYAPIAAAVAGLHGIFAEHDRPPCVVCVAQLSPALAEVLRAAGHTATREQLMLATAASEAADAPPGLTIETLADAAPAAAIRENLDINELGFNPAVTTRATDIDAERFRPQLRAGRAFTARLGGVGVGAALLTPPLDGVAEVVGVATLAAFRGRGVGGALAAHAAGTGFALGCDLVFLRAADERAGRVYSRAGYRACGDVLTWTHRGPRADPAA